MRSGARGDGAFTLTEIALAVGIISIGMIAVLGLLPAGLNAMRHGRDELAAAHCLRNLSDGIRNAERVDGNIPATYRAGGVLSNLTWTIGNSAEATLTVTNLTSAGAPAARPEDALLNARIEVAPPANPHSAGTATVSVAWPALSTWDGQKWSRNQGQIATHVVFLPK